jgi:hypothetical protein
MKNIIKFNYCILLFFASAFFSCSSENAPLISQNYADSLLNIKGQSAMQKALNADLQFWENRFKTDTQSYTNGQKYAAVLMSLFRQTGDITNLKKAEKIIRNLNKIQKEKEAGLLRTLANYASLQHQFQEADKFANLALAIGENKYESMLIQFDAAFELGKMEQAKIILVKLKKKYEYAYYFRLAKMQHYDGNLPAAIESMQMAASLSQGNKDLEQAALSNLADLALHNGNFELATINYQKSLAIDNADYHSIKGLGLVAQYHDNNYILAEKLFNFVAAKTQSPDIYFNLSQLAQSTGSQANELRFAQKFEQLSTHEKYGNMYNKYLIELYDGILTNPKAMLKITQNELKNRATPQTNSWYAWALYKNNQKNTALHIYKEKVADKPLEGLELYYLGKLMEAEKREFNANAYFEAAYKNKFELSPMKIKELELTLKS